LQVWPKLGIKLGPPLSQAAAITAQPSTTTYVVTLKANGNNHSRLRNHF
jgi:hypothetical protein